MSNYPKKTWYVAATASEVSGAPLGRRLLGEDVVLWRTAEGRLAAFQNRCAHRAFPLSHSRVDGDHLICGYHGCTYDTNGVCVKVSCQAQVPPGMRVRVFPVVEDGNFIWIWLGPLSAVAASRPPRVPWIDDPHWATFGDAWHVDANYLMVHEHLLDFSYAPVLHHGDLPPGMDSMPAFNSVEVTETTVSYERTLPELPLAGWQSDATGLDPGLGYKHSESGTFISPAIHSQHWDIETQDGTVYSTTRTHAITPESDSATHIFMASSRNYRIDDVYVTARLRRFLGSVAERDAAVLEMASRHSGYDGWRNGVEFQSDAAALRARRIVGVMLSKEAGRSPIRPGLAPASRSDTLSPSRAGFT